ncbi:MAG: SUMF1/EgtB/PvdO family nonheme iron enzyme [Sandaracinus sp.]
MSRALWAGATLALALTAGCDVQPYCLNCRDGVIDGAAIDGGARDGATDTGTGGDGSAADAGPCVPTDGGVEECNERDDDCDGNVDETFDLSSDPTHCGSCTNPCRFPNASVSCVSGSCVVGDCLPGYADVDRVAGCEYMCPVFPVVAEDCNGLDDDCDGTIDEAAGLPPPPTGLCRTTPGTPCQGVSMICATRSGQTTWFCDYPATVEFDPAIPNGILLEEARCDGQDGDCDGVVDDSFDNLGTLCDDGGRGACRDVGRIACDPADSSTTTCDLSVLPDPTPGAPSAERCNGVDDDCDGVVDNSDRSDPARVIDRMVHVARGGMDYWIYEFEASRPDASATSAGLTTARSCSSPGVVPWTRVSYADASAACAAAGFRLCTAAEWQTACSSGSAYPYGPSYDETTCNGADRMVTPATLPTGSLASCETAEGALDMSGNVKEWTSDRQGTSATGTPIYVVRGGSFESPELGLTCQTVLSQATADTLLPGLGFRCCSSTAP